MAETLACRAKARKPRLLPVAVLLVAAAAAASAGGPSRADARTGPGGPALWPAQAATASVTPTDAGTSAATEASPGSPQPVGAGAYLAASGTLTRSVFLPMVSKGPATCQAIPGETYGSLGVSPPPTDRPAPQHADLNLALRGYASTSASLGLVTIGPVWDVKAPQLPSLFADARVPAFSAAYRVRDWDWGCNCRGALIAAPEVTLVGMATTPGETIRVPNSGYDIGSGYQVLVLYAESGRVTLKYTREDNVVQGYTIHMENVCLDPNLLAQYDSLNAAGRSVLPALRGGQAFARARGTEVAVAVRDTGSFMDPRSRNDWWQGR